MPILTAYLGTVAIGADLPLEDVAGLLSVTFDGFSFCEDDSGRFEEVPAFVAALDPVEVQLFGIPEGEDGAHFVLKVVCVDEIDPLIVGEKTGSQFIKNLPCNLPVESNGYTNISGYLTSLLLKSTHLNCKALWVSNQQPEGNGNVG